MSKQNAEHVWEPKFLAEIMAGRDPHVAPSVLKPAVGLTVAGFLDLYFTNYVEAEGLSDPVTVNSRMFICKVAEKLTADTSQLAVRRQELVDQIKTAKSRARMELFQQNLRDKLVKEGKIKIYEDVIKRLASSYSNSPA